MSNKIEIGDIVRLKVGGVSMVVNAIVEGYKDGDVAICLHDGGNGVARENIRLSSLVRVDDEKETTREEGAYVDPGIYRRVLETVKFESGQSPTTRVSRDVLRNFYTWVAYVVDSLPDESLDTIKADMNTQYGYFSGQVSYLRPATVADVEKRGEAVLKYLEGEITALDKEKTRTRRAIEDKKAEVSRVKGSVPKQANPFRFGFDCMEIDRDKWVRLITVLGLKKNEFKLGTPHHWSNDKDLNFYLEYCPIHGQHYVRDDVHTHDKQYLFLGHVGIEGPSDGKDVLRAAALLESLKRSYKGVSPGKRAYI